ncbi:RNA recognition motif domain [Arabidopsis suecica]|uniref:RNA recognition motif domain n=1 Tax=Arabidopsis suecica TaxID=45249 RepID=A0A8T2BYK8_ARASU|nr:RNA recognition motif domain [Arabidopsis suecica]
MQMEKSDKQEIEKLRKSLKEMSQTIKELREIIQTRPNLPVISFRPPKKKVGPIYHNVCNFDDKDHLGLSDDALFVQGFDISPPRHEIKTALWNHFSSCGKVYQIYVPIACSSGASLGYAFIDMKDETKGLTLSGSHLGGRKLHVMMARYRSEFGCSSNLSSCQRCRTYKPWLVERALSKARFAKHWRRKPQTVGTPYSKIGRFTAIIGRPLKL